MRPSRRRAEPASSSWRRKAVLTRAISWPSDVRSRSTRSSGRLSISSGIVNVCGSNSPCAMKPAGTSSHLSPAHGVCPSQEKCVASDRGTATATPNAAAAARAPAASRCSLIPGKALLEAIVDQFGHGAPNLIHPYLIEAGHTSRTRQLVVKVVLKAHKDLDAIAD